jgi:hypothetical protein
MFGVVENAAPAELYVGRRRARRLRSAAAPAIFTPPGSSTTAARTAGDLEALRDRGRRAGRVELEDLGKAARR